MIKGVIFDIDNTLTDFMKMKRSAVDAAVEGMMDAGLPGKKEDLVTEFFEHYWKEGIEDQKIFDKILKAKLGHIDYKILASGILAYRRSKNGTMTLYPRVNQTLMELMKMGIKLTVLSDAPKMEVWLRIVSLGLHHYFDEIITSEDFGVKKPDPKPFRKALEVLGTKPEETYMVGDWPDRDVKGAKAAGIRAVWAKYGDTFGTKESGAEVDIEDIYEVVGIIKKENGAGCA
ncbi:MAG: TIGR02253 family HAD-type hydrolase [Elusimicrobiota bacterium]|nr:TIGR02253 family HAD-type hydrolase [Elusimicrobiota bacterium]